MSGGTLFTPTTVTNIVDAAEQMLLDVHALLPNFFGQNQLYSQCTLAYTPDKVCPVVGSSLDTFLSFWVCKQKRSTQAFIS